jgi:ethanolamine ammonia-lyase large subunit
MYTATIGSHRYVFRDLKTVLAKATPSRSGDQLAGVAAETDEERVAAQYALADVPLMTFLHEHVVPYETDEVTRLIIDHARRDSGQARHPDARLRAGACHDDARSDPQGRAD